MLGVHTRTPFSALCIALLSTPIRVEFTVLYPLAKATGEPRLDNTFTEKYFKMKTTMICTYKSR